jgi:hypothetical protein
MNSKRRLLSAFFGVAVAAALPAVSAELLSDEELDGVRAGYKGPDGFPWGAFTAQMATTVDGIPALISTLTFTPSEGVTITRQVGDSPNIVPLEDAGNYKLDLSKITQQGGVLIPGNGGGATAVFQNLGGPGGYLNGVVNNASGRTILQQTTLTLAIPNLQQLQDVMALQQLKSSLEQAMVMGRLNPGSGIH